MRTVGVVTVGRSDYGYLLPILKAIGRNGDLQLRLLVSGTHLSREFGLTVRTIENDGFAIADRIEMLLSSDTPESIAKSIGLGTIGFAQSFARMKPDILVLLGDRFETLAAASAALPFRIPIAHVHGGELTEGAIDEAIRHAITKMSHLHFVATELYRRRVIQLGEQPWRVTVSGAPTLDNLRGLELPSRVELESRVGMALSRPFLLVTFHPVMLEADDPGRQTGELLAALDERDYGVVFTYPGADAGSHAVIEAVRQFTTVHSNAVLVDSLGTPAYFGLMRQAAAMVGNSSSGIIEAASFKLPVVNVGTRQQGRARGPNVIDVACARDEIAAGIRTATSKAFAAGLSDLVNVYGDGGASERIVEVLGSVAIDEHLLIKHFHDLENVAT